jgi:hypothetical protein
VCFFFPFSSFFSMYLYWALRLRGKKNEQNRISSVLFGCSKWLSSLLIVRLKGLKI